MDEQYIYPSELLLLGLWVSAPALLVGLGIMAVLMWRRGLSRGGGRRKLVGAVFFSGVLAYVLTFVVWIAVPPRFLDWPGTFGTMPFMFLGVFFVPTVLSLAVVCPAGAWWALRGRGSSPTRA